MFNNELMADVHFIVGPVGAAKKVPAHKVGRISNAPVSSSGSQTVGRRGRGGCHTTTLDN